MFARPAFDPKKALLPPVVFDSPAAMPTDRLPPVLCKIRCPPMLYCAAELTTFADKVPADVPSPLILKLLDACWLVLF